MENDRRDHQKPEQELTVESFRAGRFDVIAHPAGLNLHLELGEGKSAVIELSSNEALELARMVADNREFFESAANAYEDAIASNGRPAVRIRTGQPQAIPTNRAVYRRDKPVSD